MRAILAAAALAVTFAGSASAQQSPTYEHHNFCLKTGSTTECAYDSMAQCEAAKHGNQDFCEQNGAPVNH